MPIRGDDSLSILLDCVSMVNDEVDLRFIPLTRSVLFSFADFTLNSVKSSTSISPSDSSSSSSSTSFSPTAFSTTFLTASSPSFSSESSSNTGGYFSGSFSACLGSAMIADEGNRWCATIAHLRDSQFNLSYLATDFHCFHRQRKDGPRLGIERIHDTTQWINDMKTVIKERQEIYRVNTRGTPSKSIHTSSWLFCSFTGFQSHDITFESKSACHV